MSELSPQPLFGHDDDQEDNQARISPQANMLYVWFWLRTRARTLAEVAAIFRFFFSGFSDSPATPQRPDEYTDEDFQALMKFFDSAPQQQTALETLPPSSPPSLSPPPPPPSFSPQMLPQQQTALEAPPPSLLPLPPPPPSSSLLTLLTPPPPPPRLELPRFGCFGVRNERGKFELSFRCACGEVVDRKKDHVLDEQHANAVAGKYCDLSCQCRYSPTGAMRRRLDAGELVGGCVRAVSSCTLERQRQLCNEVVAANVAVKLKLMFLIGYGGKRESCECVVVYLCIKR